ncbi:hypothetical protein BGW39_003456 [Mortierella sp. 14UC]|nr:hypothetical protein BGW39_003456 [Mortierella sp. 14UC]
MEPHMTKPKKRTLELQPQNPKNNTIKAPKAKPSRTTKVTKNKDKVQTDKKLKLKKKDTVKDKDKDAVKSKLANSEAKKSKNESVSAATASATASASSASSSKKKMAAKKLAESKTSSSDSARESKSRKRYASDIEGSDKDMEDFQAQPVHRPSAKTRRIQESKEKEDDVTTPKKKRKGSVDNQAIWKSISGGTASSSDSTTAITTIVMEDYANQDKAETTTTVDVTTDTITVKASATIGDVDHSFFENPRSGVLEMNVKHEDSEDHSGDDSTETISGGQGLAAKAPRSECLHVLDETELEKL